MFGRFTTWQSASVRSQSTLLLLTTADPPPGSWRNGCVGSTPESMTPTETPLPVRAVPSAPVRVLIASSPRVEVWEVYWLISIGWLPSRYVTPGTARAAVICARVPRATTTAILSNVVTVDIPVVVTAPLAAARLLPCTRTVSCCADTRVLRRPAR